MTRSSRRLPDQDEGNHLDDTSSGATAHGEAPKRFPRAALRSAVTRYRDDTPELSGGGLWSVAGISALLAVLAGARPVGIQAADVFWCAAFGATMVLVASRARRWALVWLGGLSTVVAIGGNASGMVCAIALVPLVGFVAFSSDRRDRLSAALIGAIAAQALLRGPSYGFTGLPALVALVAIAPVIWSGYRLANRRERELSRRVVLVAAIGVAAASAAAVVAVALTYNDLRSAEQGANTGLDLVRTGETQDATTRFERAGGQFERSTQTLNGPLTWSGRLVPIVSQHVEALTELSSAGEALSRSAAETTSTADYRSLAPDGGTVSIDRIVALQQPVAAVSAVISNTREQLSRLDSVWLLEPFVERIDRLGLRLDDVDEQTDLASQALTVAPALLGADGPTRYFVAFSTPAESRNGGGFIGAYGLLEAENGSLELLESGDLSDLNPAGGLKNAYSFLPPLDWEQRYGSYFVPLFLGNLAASPDWPTDTGVIGQLFPQTKDAAPIAGAIYADPAALAGLLELTGPIRVAGIDQELTDQNAEQFLLVDQYVEFNEKNEQRKELLADVARATFDALTSRPLPGISRLTEVMGPLVADGHLRISTFEPDAEAFLDRIGISGRWHVDPGADFLSVRSANLLPNKIDAYLHRDISVTTTVDPVSRELVTDITVVLRNDAPDEGLPPYLIGDGSTVEAGTNRNSLSINTPHALRGATLDGEPVSIQSQREFGAPVYSVVTEVPAQSARTLRITLVGQVDRWPYALEVLPQAMANPDTMSISVVGVPGLAPAPQFNGTLGPRFLVGTK